MVICEKCVIKNKSDEGVDSILDFPFKLYENRNLLKKDLLSRIESNRDFLTKINDKYDSNIIHELVYKLVKAKFIDKQYRKQHVWALEILSDLPEYPMLLLQKNTRNEIPIEAYVRLAEDNHTKHYDDVIKLLSKNSEVPIIILQKDKASEENDTSLENSIVILEEKKKIIHPQVALLTNQYHNLQEKLFKYLETKYNEKVTKCENCNNVIDLFNDLENIGIDLKSDKNIKIIIKNIEHIISLRNQAIELSEDNEVNRRHKHIIVYFEKLLDLIRNKEEIESNLKVDG